MASHLIQEGKPKFFKDYKGATQFASKDTTGFLAVSKHASFDSGLLHLLFVLPEILSLLQRHGLQLHLLSEVSPG